MNAPLLAYAGWTGTRRLCQDALLTSFDGTSATRYACTLPRLDLEVRQGHLWRDLC